MSWAQVEAEILRKRPDIKTALNKSAPTATGAGSTPGSGSARPGSEWGPVLEQIALSKIKEQTVAIDKIRAMKGQPPMAKREESGRSSAAILAEVDRLANAITKSKGGPTKAAAKAEVWHTHPDLKTEVRKAQAREIKAGREAGKDVAAEIDRIIKSYALSISATPENMAKTLSQIKNELMHTAAGIEIRKLRADAMAGKVASETDIRKSGEHSDAWSVLKSWEPAK
jgi:hypothetical protein